MSYYRRDEWVTDAMGNAQSGASVYVCSQPANTGSIPPSPLVTVYSDPNGAFPITQPVITDGYGHAFYYVATGTYTVVYYSPQIQTLVLADQSVAPGGVSIPVTVAQGGTGAITASAARTNLGTAASGANADITSLSDIGNTTINSSGYILNNGTAAQTTTISSPGWQWGTGSFNSGGSSQGFYVANQTWTGTGYSGLAAATCDTSGNFTLMGTSGFFTTGTLQGNYIKSLGDLAGQGILHVNTIECYNPGTTLNVLANGIVGAGSVSLAINGNSVANQALLGFVNYSSQTNRWRRRWSKRSSCYSRPLLAH